MGGLKGARNETGIFQRCVLTQPASWAAGGGGVSEEGGGPERAAAAGDGQGQRSGPGGSGGGGQRAEPAERGVPVPAAAGQPVRLRRPAARVRPHPRGRLLRAHLPPLPHDRGARTIAQHCFTVRFLVPVSCVSYSRATALVGVTTVFPELYSVRLHLRCIQVHLQSEQGGQGHCQLS